MTVPNESESSEDVNDFLQRIRELGERRDKEDVERTKKLEEEILQGRKERQARRAERARSIALTDDSSTLNIARLSASSISPGSINPPEHLEPTPHTEPETPSGVDLSEDTEPITDRRRGSVQDPGMESPSRTLPPLSRSRTGTLSWQQRPTSRDFGSMSPGSTSPTRSPTRASHLRNHSTASDDRPRSQYGFPRLSKDFTGFSVSPERAVGSVNPKKEEPSDSQADSNVGHVPEMSEESSDKLDKLEAVDERPSSPTRAVSRDSSISHRFSVSSVSATGLGSPVHLSEAQKLEPRPADSSFEEPASSPTQRRMSPERARSTSPTKGMGGFVQSAMMRRSDSVSKRWSAQIPQGLSRSNSIISNRSSVAGPSLTEMAPPTLSRSARDPSVLPPRPDSSHSEAPSEITERPTTPSGPTLADRDSFRTEGSPSRPFRPGHSRSASSVTADGDAQSGSFVSKTMDPRRWSPSKATWLESALNRPELPRQNTRPPSQPNWARDRQSRGSVDMGRVNNFKEVTPVGLMRTPPLGFLKKTGVSGPSLPSSPDKENPPESPIGFPLKKIGVSGASVSGSPDGKFKEGIPGSPLASPLKRPSISGPSVSGSPEGKFKESAPDSPAEFPFKKSSMSGASLPRGSVAESPSEFPFKRPSFSGASLSGSPKANAKETIPDSPSGGSFKKSISSISGISIPGSPASPPKDIAPDSPSVLGDSSTEPTTEDTPTSPSHIEDTLKALSGEQPVEEPKSVSPVGVESESQEQQVPAETEVTPEPEATPTRRDPPEALVSPKPNFSISTSSRGLISPKPKPPQSPVVDFRANLRKREVVKDSGDSKEPEFKNVFGRLKKTETRNYVAPDELKGNILRGKAALNATGGPKKTERVDEFRKSLVDRKDEMKAGGGSIRRNTAGEKDAPEPAKFVPEAIAKRQNMNRANSTKQITADEPSSPSKSVGSRASQDIKPFSPISSSKEVGSSRTSQEQEPLSPFPTDDELDEPSWPLKTTSAAATRLSQTAQPISPSPAAAIVDKDEAGGVHATSDYQHTPELKSPTQDESREIEPMTEKKKQPTVAKTRPLRELPQAPIAEATASPVQAAKSKLAGRINPALAGLLSRGPPAPEGPKRELPTVSTQSKPGPSAPLEHATKGRARGPKRRPPQAAAISSPSIQNDTKEVGAISYEDTPSQTPPSPVESLDDDSDRLSQYDEDSVPDTDIPRAESPLTELLPSTRFAAEQLPADQLSFDQPSAEDLPIEQFHFNQDPVEQSFKQPSIEHLPIEEPLAEEHLVQQFDTEHQSIDKPPAEGLPIEQFHFDQDPVAQPSEQSSSEQHFCEQLPIEETLAEEHPIQHTEIKQPATEQLPLQESLTEGPLVEKSDIERSFIGQHAVEQPPTKKLPIEQFHFDQDPVEQSSEQPNAEQFHVERHSIEQVPIEEPIAEEALAEQPHVQQIDIEEHSIEQPLAEESSIEQPPVEQLDIANHSSEQPLAEQIHVERLPAEQSPVEQIPVEKPLAEELPAKTFDIPQPSLEQPPAEDLAEVNTPPPVPLKKEPPSHRFPQPLQTRSLTTDFNTFPSRKPEATPREPLSSEEPSPSSGPPVPSKSSSPMSLSPSTPKSRWAQQNRYASPSPSPLRSSYNENRMDSPVSQRSLPGVTVDSSRESLSRPVNKPSPPVPPKDDDLTLQKPVDPRRLSRKMSAPSLVAQAGEAKEVIAGFFKTFPNPQKRMDIDPQLMLMNKSDESKIRTVKRHIWELTGDGRRQELPSHQEYILYQGSMYICVHMFETGRSTTSEVYLWCGDDVPDVAIDSEQAFARKVARENSSKLQVIRQGKEPTRFIQALGGIMITRRGSSSRHNSSALYILCGRKHLGQMTFDEVDYSMRNLCSGFPYVISAPFGKLYLWKGKGSGPEETGAARLIGMDLGLTGEFEEVAEGEEPEDFFDVFAGPKEAAPHMCQDYWKLKPKYNHFRTRLLRVDHELGQPTRFWNLRRPGSGSPVIKPNDCVQEIEPFCYRDITDKDVYVLDTFFEIYVIIGEQATQKSADFASALVFAHEYGILATSLQDRPFIPKSFVALGGIADRCQSAFRKWNPRTHHAPFIFPLDVVLEALRSPEENE